MRIAIMLRAYDMPGGIGIYTRNIVKHLLKIDKENHYILIYNNRNHLGIYKNNNNVDEFFIPPANTLIWDQILVPKLLKKIRPDLIFHTKFTVPIVTKAKKIMALHGASWFVHPELYGKFDIFYVRTAMPIYCRMADYLISNSNLTTWDHIKILNIPEEKIETVLLSAGDEFVRIEDSRVLEDVRLKYKLPDRFILTVTGYDPRKNFKTLIKAFEKCLKEIPIHLVVVGKDCNKYSIDLDIFGRNIEKFIHFTGWVEQEDLPSFYTMADAFVFPSVYEEFGIPVVEAMSCGCPIVSSTTGAIPELTNEAALLNAPFDTKALAKNILKFLTSPSTREKYRQKGFEQARRFSWEKTAQETLEIFNRFA